jgi:L-phenylalanine/L-methionine N-acetyltransferase
MAAEPGFALSIRRAGAEDCEAIWRAFQDEAAYSGTLQVPFPSREVWRKRICEPPEGDFILVAVAGDEVVGNAGLHRAGTSPRRAHAMMLGITVHREWQGKGVGRALMQALVDLADNWLPVSRIELTVFTDNERAIALYRQFGFEIEGTHKAYALRAGRYVDTYAMARVRGKPAVA